MVGTGAGSGSSVIECLCVELLPRIKISSDIIMCVLFFYGVANNTRYTTPAISS